MSFETIQCNNCGKLKEGLSLCIQCHDENVESWAIEVKRLEKRLSKLEETCPDCKGSGRKSPRQSSCSDDCPTCQGSGKVPICYLPDEVIQFLYENSTYYGIEFGNTFQIKILDDRHPDDREDDLKTVYEFIKYPNTNIWKFIKSEAK